MSVVEMVKRIGSVLVTQAPSGNAMLRDYSETGRLSLQEVVSLVEAGQFELRPAGRWQFQLYCGPVWVADVQMDDWDETPALDVHW
ncbi:MAG: hypothetical protein J2P46_07940 [Zavarzinella sp.]|nr:hypothetical protein [Zavarzinella sp.]